ncbi:MAG: C40 family peptidase [Polynucleobacter victoriensis]
MSLKKALLSKVLGLSFGAIIAVSAYAADPVAEAPAEAAVPRESMFQSGRSYIARVSDRLADTVTGKSDELINRAMEVIGVRYRWDAELPQSGLDGSSFVGYVFKDKLGFLLPRKSTQMSRVGKPITREELQPGDLVFFNTMRLTFSHVGIYVGDNKFIHAPSKGKSIRVDDMTKAYWEKRYNGARRMEGFDAMTEQQRQQLLLDYQERIEKSGRL